MVISELGVFMDRLEKVSSRLEITRILSELYIASQPKEIDKTTYLILGILAPSYKGIVFNLAERMMLKVLAQAYDTDIDKVKKLYKEKGDLGNVAEGLAQNLKLPPGRVRDKAQNLSVLNVYELLLVIAQDAGEGSQERKIQKMADLLKIVDPLSARYISRMPVGRLRLGFSDKTILDALSWMEVGDKTKKVKLERAYQVIPDVGLLAKHVKEVGIDKAVKNIKPVVGIPVLPMLAQRIKSPKEMIDKMGEVVVEPKFDGLRVQIHFKRGKGGSQIDSSFRASNGTQLNAQSAIQSGEVKAFTRNLNNIVDMFPELKEIGKYITADEVILGTEAVGMDPEMKQLANFQTTMQRRRKYEIEQKAKDIPVRFQVFDMIFVDGKSLMDEPYLKRRVILEKVFKDNTLFVVDEKIATTDPDVINDEYRKNIAEGLEGVIVKKANAEYVPGRTGWRWVKMKQEEEASAKLSDSVDCVVMGYTAGRGKRALFGLGQFLAGIIDYDVIKTVTKIGTGISDEQFRELFIRLRKLKVKDKPKEYGDVSKLIIPDVWVEPSLVVEIAADEITKSPIHSAGYALRFPRLIKFRDDKSWDEATTLKELKRLSDFQKS
ncbi:hypothetical protein A3E41_04980 [Candidatus Woesebacteria bacterium RIFCSPHIGHO2_12_FULL_38_9]|nr:MAG: hypothetical protein A3E41_04980 [Candidatus Woesebacteria bacterium RIFCSPHIGHO2_12_FULL_38_9]